MDYFIEDDNYDDQFDHNVEDYHEDLMCDDPYDEDNVPMRKKIFKAQKYFLGGHLTSPIYDHESHMIFVMQPVCKRHKDIQEFLERENIHLNWLDVCPDPVGCIEAVVDKSPLFIDQKELELLYKSNLDAACESWRIHKLSTLSPVIEGEMLSSESVTGCVDSMKEWMLGSYKDLKRDFRIMKIIEFVKDQICYKEYPLGKFIRSLTFLVEKDLTVFSCKHGSKMLGPTTMLMCGLDKAQSMFSLKFYWKSCDAQLKYPMSIFEHGLRLDTLFKSIRPHCGQDFFSLLANWEPLVVGHSIMAPGDVRFNKLFDESKKEIQTIIDKYNLKISIDDLIPEGWLESDLRLWMELVGISKSYGFPTLVIENLLDQMREHGRHIEQQMDTDLINELVSIFKRDFCLQYRKKKDKYPSIKLSSIDPTLAPFIRSGKIPPKNLRLNYPIWGQLIFDKIFDYDFSPDTSELIKDSAAAIPFTHWFLNYDPCAFKYHYGKVKPSGSLPEGYSKRIIESYLTGGEEDTKKKITELMDCKFSLEDSTAEQCGKEQELKIGSGRAFTKQTYKQRLAQCSMEHNLAMQVFPFIPEQTMTDPEIVNLRRTLQNVDDIKHDYDLINLDLTKWNLRFRHDSVYPFGKVLDQMFGTPNLYQFNHVWFIESNIITNSRMHPPDYDDLLQPIPGAYYINNHLGGMEGMRQKLWTLITIQAIKYTSERLNLNVSIMGQGDNQVVILKYTAQQKPDRETIRNAFLVELESNFKLINLKLKLSETWISNRIHEYGKERYYNGVAVSQATKKVAKLIPDINDGLFTFMTPLSTINTLTESIAKADFSPDRAFLLNQFQVLNYLHRKKIVNHQTRKQLLTAILFYPADFGGITLSTLFSHTIRGHDDKLSLWCHLIKTAKEYSPQTFDIIKKICQFTPKRKATMRDKERLFEDIFCLNIDSLPTIEADLKRRTMEYLKSEHVTNPEIKRLYSGESTVKKDKLILSFLSMKPLFLQLAHTLLSLSNEGILIALRNKFTNIQTVSKLTQSVSDLSYIDKVRANNLLLSDVLRRRFKRYVYDPNSDVFDLSCPTIMAKRLRWISWELDTVSLTKPPPMHQVIIKPFDECTRIERGSSITVKTTRSHAEYPEVAKYECGEFSGYIGSATREKIKKPTLDVATKTPYVKALQQLGTIYTWLQILKCNNLLQLVKALIDEKAPVVKLDVDLSEPLSWTATTYGGNIFHRFFSSVERSTAILNFLPTLSSHFQQRTDELKVHTSGGRDYTVFFQILFLNNIHCIHEALVLNNELRGETEFCSILVCGHCTEEITGICFDIDPYDGGPGMSPLKIESEIKVDFPYNYHDSKKMMEKVVGIIMSSLVDKAFSRYYNEWDDNIKTEPFASLAISVNDFRLLDIYNVMKWIIVYSDFTFEILMEKNLAAIYRSYNKSYEFLSKMIIESDHMFPLLAKYPFVVTEHYQTLNPEMLSTIIPIILTDIVMDDPRGLLTVVFGTVLKNEPELSVERTYSRSLRLVEKYGSLKPQLLKRLRQPLAEKGLYGNSKIMEILGAQETPTYYRLTKEEVMLFWRTSPRPTSLVDCDQSHLRSARFHPLQGGTYGHHRYLTYIRERIVHENDRNKRFELSTICHIARSIGCISTGCGKYVEILLITNLRQFIGNEILNIYNLAEGSGSVSGYFMSCYKDTKIGYNTLMDADIDKRCSSSLDFPPACVARGAYNPQRMINHMPLARGETNILRRSFISKLECNWCFDPPGVLTIDAESMTEGTNSEFLEIFIPLVVKHECKVFICKIFMLPALYDTIYTLTRDIVGYEWLLIKPVTSNPVGNELFFVMISSSLINMMSEKDVETIMNLRDSRGQFTWMTSKCCPISENLTRSYIRTALEVSKTLESLPEIVNGNYKMVDKYDGFVRSIRPACSPYCKKVSLHLLELLDSTHRFDSDSTIKTIIREGGIDKFIKDLMSDLLFLNVFADLNGDLVNTINTLSPFTIRSDLLEYRKNMMKEPFTILTASLSRYSFFNEWTFQKYYLRNQKEYVPCNCKIKRIKIDLDKIRRSLAYNLIDSMKAYSLIRDRITDVYFSIDRSKVSIELVGDNGIN